MLSHLDLASYPYPGMRKALLAMHGAVATSQPLAAQAGLAILKQGGNAVDAAIATAIALTVVDPASCGVGGDVFALVWDGSALSGLNGSGRAPATLTAEVVRQRGHEAVPSCGWLPVTVPGAPAAWYDLHQRSGKLAFPALFEPAILYAEHGYPVSPTSAMYWSWATELHRRLQGEEFAGFETLYTPTGRAPAVGEIWRNPDLARTLRLIAQTNAAALYHGELAQRIAAFSARTGGWLTEADLARHSCTWGTPISTNYRGYDIWEMPPSSQGLTSLLALNILEGFDLESYERESVESYHLQLEALKLAFVDAQRYIADPELADVPTQELLSKEYAIRRRSLIGDRARTPEPGNPLRGDTALLCTADADGMMVCLIQSVSSLFGSHVVVPGTGFALQNRGQGFSLDPQHPNRLEPGKRPFHTIIPCFLTHEGQAIGPFGVKGGHMQPQGHLQMIVNTIDYGLNPQASLDAPRWFWEKGRSIKVEPTVDPTIVKALSQLGHDVKVERNSDVFGCGQIIWRLPSGVYVAGSDGRTDGIAIGY